MAGAGMSQQAALQDQMNAQQALTGALGSGRGQDLGWQQQVTGANLNNAQLQQGQYGLNTQRGLGYTGAAIGMDQNQLAVQQAAYQAQLQQQDAMKGGLFKTGGSMLAASDERLKTDVSDAGDDIDDMLNHLVAKTYRYKDEAKYGAGPRAGIMAQDLEKSRAGSALVVDLPDDPGMKGFDVTKAVSAALAASARLNERMRKLEGSRG
jgi:hypothetical protein